MKIELNTQQIRAHCQNAIVFPKEILSWIAGENLWNIWVPHSYGGLEQSFSQGLKTLKALAKIDGSLGWTITLCSGANYFIGNLKPEVAAAIFDKNRKDSCFGGSGGAFGKAEKYGNRYKINGRWHYATGAPYLSHFTLNAKIFENGKAVQDTAGNPLIRSFLIPKEKVQIVEDWNTMGLQATATHSFDVDELWVDEKYSFTYNRFYLDQPIFKIPFAVFADLTLWVNYVGMASHFLEASERHVSAGKTSPLADAIAMSNEQIFALAETVEERAREAMTFSEKFTGEIHNKAARSVKKLTASIVELYPLLGIKAGSYDHQLNQVFRDYFTATQHHIFVDR